MTQSKWPSPAEDYIEQPLDLNRHLVTNPPATFFFEAEGHDMRNAGICHKDILIVDRSIAPGPGKIVVAALDGRLVVRRIKQRGPRLFLKSEDRNTPEINITENPDAVIWGVMKHVIHKLTTTNHISFHEKL